MEALAQSYIDTLEAIKAAIAGSAQLATYLDTEESEDYLELRRAVEPAIHQLHQQVAMDHPMQLIDFERRLCDAAFEGLYMPRMLGYSILRGAVDDQYRFIRPQEHFKYLLHAIATSSNFDVVSIRIGQSLQIGFALSSDIWSTSLINSIPSKRVRDFYRAQKLDKYHDLAIRRTGYVKYAKQFSDFIYQTADFPSSASELSVFYPELKEFFVKRVWMDHSIDNIEPYIAKMAADQAMWPRWQFIYTIGLLANYFQFDMKATTEVNNSINRSRKENVEFQKTYFEFLKELLLSDIPVDSACHDRISSRLDKSIEDDFSAFYALMDILHVKGWVHEEAIQAVREFYEGHEGRSTVNECVRLTIYKFFSKIVRNLPMEEYHTILELFKTMTIYMGIFNNQHFNQATKKRTLWFVKKFNKVYTDKRGKEYQEMKKFIASTFVELNLMTTKEVTAFFKTPRKKKVATPARP